MPILCFEMGSISLKNTINSRDVVRNIQTMVTVMITIIAENHTEQELGDRSE